MMQKAFQKVDNAISQKRQLFSVNLAVSTFRKGRNVPLSI